MPFRRREILDVRPAWHAQSQAEDYSHYRDAFAELASGSAVLLVLQPHRHATGVEHIQPKLLPAYRHLEALDNFLLGCVNRNSTKGSGCGACPGSLPTATTLPPLTNTRWTERSPSRPVFDAQRSWALNTLRLVGLDKRLSEVVDSTDNPWQSTAWPNAWNLADRPEQKQGRSANESTDALRRQLPAPRRVTGSSASGCGVQRGSRRAEVADSGVRRHKEDCFDGHTTAVVAPPSTAGLTAESLEPDAAR